MKRIMKIVMVFLLVCNLCVGNICYARTSDENVIYKYYELLSEGKQNDVLALLGGEYYSDASVILQNELNKENKIGLYNIKKASIRSIIRIINPYEIPVEYDSYVNAKSVYEVNVDVQVYCENEYIQNGLVKRYFILDTNSKIIGCTSIMVENNNDGIMTLSCDTPKKGIKANPSTIKVLRTKKGTIEEVGFYKYCEVVTVNEVGYNWKQDALDACALAIKNYGVSRKYNKKYPDLGYDVKDTEADQVYDPKKSSMDKCNKAVSNIWYYFMYDAKDGLFPGFHVHSAAINSYAKKNGGIVSQTKSRDLANDGKKWKQIVKYFYNRASGTDYYNKDVAVGAISVQYFYSK
ncbi:MAG: SpoIID/LytB domain-containing protein [Lachnospiraceae bacterium]|nr:SpoIID/LytB domain-containing protein [Lachnospiraceae bacterium]